MSNSDFSAGLTDWQTQGAVFPTGNQGVLTDQGVARSLLYQVVSVAPGDLFLTFDFRNLLSSSLGTGGLRDTFFATVYLTNTPGALDIANNTGFTSAISLFDLDSNGLFNVHPTATTGPSPLGGGFTRFSVNFFNSATHVAPAFDLVDLNLVNNDSVVLADNVDLTVVPEPGTVATALSSLFLSLFFRRRVRERLHRV